MSGRRKKALRAELTRRLHRPPMTGFIRGEYVNEFRRFKRLVRRSRDGR